MKVIKTIYIESGIWETARNIAREENVSISEFIEDAVLEKITQIVIQSIQQSNQ
jgi:hypothetical protein